MDKPILKAELIKQITFCRYIIKASFFLDGKIYNSEQIAHIIDCKTMNNGSLCIKTHLNPFDAILIALYKKLDFDIYVVKDECKKTFTVGLMGRL